MAKGSAVGRARGAAAACGVTCARPGPAERAEVLVEAQLHGHRGRLSPLRTVRRCEPILIYKAYQQARIYNDVVIFLKGHLLEGETAAEADDFEELPPSYDMSCSALIK